MVQRNRDGVFFNSGGERRPIDCASAPRGVRQMTRHRVFTFGGAALFFAAAIVLFASSSCGNSNSNPGCDGATRGCVQLVNTVLADITVNVQGDGSAVVPAGTASAPGNAWISVSSTVGAQVTFYISQFNPGIDTCIVGSNAWSDPSKPPQVSVYTAFGPTALRCGANW